MIMLPIDRRWNNHPYFGEGFVKLEDSPPSVLKIERTVKGEKIIDHIWDCEKTIHSKSTI